MPTLSIGPGAFGITSVVVAAPGYGWGYGTSKGQIGVSFLNAPAQTLDLTYGVPKVVALGTVSQDEKGSTLYPGPSNPATTPQAPHADGWYAASEGTGGDGVAQPDNTIRSNNAYLDVPLSFMATDGGSPATFSFLAALGRISSPAPAGTTGSVSLYLGYVAGPDVDYRLDLGTQTAAFANGDKLKVTFNALALSNNPDAASLTASFVLSGPPPSYAIAATDAAKLEGNSGTTPFTFTVTRTGDTSAAATLGFAVTGSGANPAAASDFAGGTLPNGNVTFAAGATAATITVGVAGDTLVEPDEGFTVTLSGPTGTAIATPAASGTIRNDDTPPSYTIAATDAVKLEGNSGTTPFIFTVTRTGDSSAAATLGLAVTGSGANPAAASDFAGGTLPNGTVAFAAGATAATIAVNVAGDTLVEADEGFTVTLSGPAGTIIATPAASGTIRNDDAPPPPTGPTNIGALHGNHATTSSPTPADSSTSRIPYPAGTARRPWPTPARCASPTASACSTPPATPRR